MALKRSAPLQHKRKARRKRAPTELTRCDFWHGELRKWRCTGRGVVVVDENERYCATHAVMVADRYVGDAVRLRDDRCVLADFDENPCTGDRLYWAHLIPKGRYPSIRWEPDNAVAACSGHHMAFDHSPLEKDEWIRAHLGDRYDELKLQARTERRPKVADVILRFKGSA